MNTAEKFEKNKKSITEYQSIIPAFMVIGVPFFILGLNDGMSAFFVIGIVFLICSVSWYFAAEDLKKKNAALKNTMQSDAKQSVHKDPNT